MPERIARLPRDPRGFPIPWNVLRGEEGRAFFTINDEEKHQRAIRSELCPICGERLGRWRWFTGGPRSAFDPRGAYIDLPAHHECAQFALVTCPWLALPRYRGMLAEGVIPHSDELPDALLLQDPTMIPERPALFVSVASDQMTILEGPPLPYVRPAQPYLAVEYWRHGQELPFVEALPYLRESLGADWLPPAFRE